MHGFVVDPGAASGLIGTETFRKHKVDNLDPRGLRYTIRPSLASFVGISGVSESGLGILEMPCGLEGYGLIYWSADLMGNTGSICPALLANNTLLKLRAASVADVLENGAGIVSLEFCPGISTLFVIYLADSGHYLLPYDKFESKPAYSQEQLRKIFSARMHQIADAQRPQTSLRTAPCEVTVMMADKPSQDQAVKDTEAKVVATNVDGENDLALKDLVSKVFSAQGPVGGYYSRWLAWNQPTFEKNMTPNNLEDKAVVRNRLGKIPERFYSLTGLPVVTPHNAANWSVEVCQKTALHFQHFCSGQPTPLSLRSAQKTWTNARAHIYNLL